jgi:hypothetical protein
MASSTCPNIYFDLFLGCVYCSDLLFSIRKPVVVVTFCPLLVRRSLHQNMVLSSLVVDVLLNVAYFSGLMRYLWLRFQNISC